jgi:spermidine/putrescine transport system substrate-binding protein
MDHFVRRLHTRRQFLRTTSRLAVATGLAVPLTRHFGRVASGDGGDLPLPTMDNPLEMPDNDFEPIASGLDPEDGTFQLFSYPDYLNPETLAAFEATYGVTIEYSTFETEERLLAGLATESFAYDVVVGGTTLNLPRHVVGNLIQPLNRDYLTNFANVLPGLQDPYSDLGSKYTVPYTVYTTGVGHRRDVVDLTVFESDDAWTVLGDPAYQGYVGVIDDAREALTLAMYIRGVFDTNTGDPDIIAQAESDLRDLIAATNARLDILAYQKIPDGTSHVNQCWSGDMLAALQYLPEGTGPDVLGYWAPERTTVANDFFMVPGRSERPVLAHAFIDFLLDPANATQNFAYVGYQPALVSPSADELIDAGLVPEHLRSALVSDGQVTNGYRLDALPLDVQLMWEDAYNRVKAG